MKLSFFLLLFLIIACTNSQIPNPTCDTSQSSTFSSDVFPLIQQKCLSCHDSANHFGGIVLETYEQLKESAASGELYDSVVSINGYAPRMPKGGKLSDCELIVLKNWILAGMPKN